MNMNDEEMQRMLAEMGKYAEMPKAIRVTVRYDSALQKITGRAEDPMLMGEGSTFLYLLQNVLMAYPEIEEKYPPGALGFLIHETPPKTYSPLFDGDIVFFSVARGK